MGDVSAEKGARTAARKPAVTLLRVAWLAVALGLAMEGLLLFLAAGFGEEIGLGAVVADLVRNVTWAAFVCVGLAIGTTISRLQIPAMGFFGLFAAPLAFEVSRSVHKGTLQALSVTDVETLAASPTVLALVKASSTGAWGSWSGGSGATPGAGQSPTPSRASPSGSCSGGRSSPSRSAPPPNPSPRPA